MNDKDKRFKILLVEKYNMIYYWRLGCSFLFLQFYVCQYRGWSKTCKFARAATLCSNVFKVKPRLSFLIDIFLYNLDLCYKFYVCFLLQSLIIYFSNNISGWLGGLPRLWCEVYMYQREWRCIGANYDVMVEIENLGEEQKSLELNT